MATSERELANVETAKAYQVGDLLLVRIAGEKPNGCHFLDLERSLLDVEPPAFIATWFMPLNVRCVLEPMPYEYQEAFRLGVERDTVKIYHAEGELLLEVEDLGPKDRDLVASVSTGLVSTPSSGAPIKGSEAIGYSTSFDLAEAMREAISKIETPAIPDWLATYTVVEVGAEIGGIAGFNRMFVRVRGG